MCLIMRAKDFIYRHLCSLRLNALAGMERNTLSDAYGIGLTELAN
jgi:hypothetical protein